MLHIEGSVNDVERSVQGKLDTGASRHKFEHSLAFLRQAGLGPQKVQCTPRPYRNAQSFLRSKAWRIRPLFPSSLGPNSRDMTKL